MTPPSLLERTVRYATTSHFPPNRKCDSNLRAFLDAFPTATTLDIAALTQIVTLKDMNGFKAALEAHGICENTDAYKTLKEIREKQQMSATNNRKRHSPAGKPPPRQTASEKRLHAIIKALEAENRRLLEELARRPPEPLPMVEPLDADLEAAFAEVLSTPPPIYAAPGSS